MAEAAKPLVWFEGQVRSPPFSKTARLETGFLLRRLQQGEPLGLPASRPMPNIGSRCHELRVRDRDHYWRIIYRIDKDAIVISDVFAKKTGKTPARVIQNCKARLTDYDKIARGKR